MKAEIQKELRQLRERKRIAQLKEELRRAKKEEAGITGAGKIAYGAAEKAAQTAQTGQDRFSRELRTFNQERSIDLNPKNRPRTNTLLNTPKNSLFRTGKFGGLDFDSE